jgi:hypothetical protein
VTLTEQLALPIAPVCKQDCDQAVVGHSVTGNGHVCKRCNEREWGEALLGSPYSDYRMLGQRLIADSRAAA